MKVTVIQIVIRTLEMVPKNLKMKVDKLKIKKKSELAKR